ncbi:MAG: murein biosynthesis integral membrane protein MurJ [Planctomycetes bacterium]|nr:murein biosynthesis integral membrane protein MurJ [Planctomycetota bacterium]
MTKRDNLEKNTRTNWSLTLVSRVMGLVRDGAVSRLFGMESLASAFYFAFLIPNVFRRLFGEGALAVAFLPSYSKLHHEDPELAKQFATLTISKLIVLLGTITIVGELLLWWLISMQTESSDSLELAMIMLPYMPLVCCVAIFAAMLHVHDTFGPPAAAPILLNGFMIASLFGFIGYFANPLNHMMAVGVSVVLAGLIQVVWSLLAIRKFGWYSRETCRVQNEFCVMKRRMLPMIVGLGTIQINTLLDGLIASWPTLVTDSSIFGFQYPLGVGAMGSLTWAQRLYQFPLGVFGIAVATAIYPLLTKQNKDTESFTNTMHRGLRLVVFVGLPASAGLILVRNPLATVVFQGVNFTNQDALVVGSILLGYAPAVWAYSMIHVLTKGFYAKNDIMTPVKVAVFCVALNFLLNMTLIWTPLRTAGLAWSTAICAVIQVSVLMFLIRKHVSSPVDQTVVRSWCTTALLTFAMGGAVALVIQMWSPTAGVWHSTIVLVLAVLVGVSFVGIGSFLLRKPELNWILGRTR